MSGKQNSAKYYIFIRLLIFLLFILPYNFLEQYYIKLPFDESKNRVAQHGLQS